MVLDQEKRSFTASMNNAVSDKALRQLRIGSLVWGTARRLTNYGVFMSLDNTFESALLHITNVSWNRVPTIESVRASTRLPAVMSQAWAALLFLYCICSHAAHRFMPGAVYLLQWGLVVVRSQYLAGGLPVTVGHALRCRGHEVSVPPSLSPACSLGPVYLLRFVKYRTVGRTSLHRTSEHLYGVLDSQMCV